MAHEITHGFDDEGIVALNFEKFTLQKFVKNNLY